MDSGALLYNHIRHHILSVESLLQHAVCIAWSDCWQSCVGLIECDGNSVSNASCLVTMPSCHIMCLVTLVTTQERS